MTDEQRHDIAELLQRLNSASAGAAWSVFIDRYAPLIMQSVRQFDYREDRRHECFLHVCEKLSDRRFRRLKKFNTSGRISFRHWLSTVVFNLCVDWHRAEFGRAVVLPAIAALPAFDRVVYRLCIEQGQSVQDCFEQIRTDFPDLERAQVSASLKRVFRSLRPKQRWQISARLARKRKAEFDEKVFISALPGPEEDSIRDQQSAALNAALSKLDPEQRRLLVFRFQEGLSFDRIAKIEGLGNAHRARRRVNKALDALHLRLSGSGIDEKRQN